MGSSRRSGFGESRFGAAFLFSFYFFFLFFFRPVGSLLKQQPPGDDDSTAVRGGWHSLAARAGLGSGEEAQAEALERAQKEKAEKVLEEAGFWGFWVLVVDPIFPNS